MDCWLCRVCYRQKGISAETFTVISGPVVTFVMNDERYLICHSPLSLLLHRPVNNSSVVLSGTMARGFRHTLVPSDVFKKKAPMEGMKIKEIARNLLDAKVNGLLPGTAIAVQVLPDGRHFQFERLDEEDDLMQGHVGVALDQRTVRHVGPAQIQQPGDFVQGRHDNSVKAELLQLVSHHAHLLLPRLACATQTKTFLFISQFYVFKKVF